MLYSIDKSNKDIAISIMRKAMSSSPNLRWITGNEKPRLQRLYNFCLHLAMLYKGAYLNPDKKGVVFFYKRGHILAVDPNDKSTKTVIKLRDYLFQQSKKEQLPIYIQTALKRNKTLFEKFGFVCYKKLENENYSLWLLKRDYEK